MCRLSILTLVTSLLLSSCADDHGTGRDPAAPSVPSSEPPSPDSQRVPPSPLGTPGATEPAEPTTSAVAEPVGPEATVRAWVKAYNQVVAGASAEAVYGLSTSACKTCREIVDPVLNVYEVGGNFDTTGWSVKKAIKAPTFDRSREVIVGLEYAAGQTVPEAGAEPIEYDVERHRTVFTLVRIDGEWRVDRLEYLPGAPRSCPC